MKGHMHELPAKCFANSNDLIDRPYSNNKHVAIDDIADDWKEKIIPLSLFLYKFLVWHNPRDDFWCIYILPFTNLILQLFTFYSILLSHSFSLSLSFCVVVGVCVCSICMYLYTYMFAYFFRTIWISCRHHDVLNLNLQCLFSKDKDIFLYNYNTVIKIKIPRTDLTDSPCSNFISCSNNVSYCFFPCPWPDIVFSRFVSLASFNLKYFLSLALCFLLLIFLKSTGRYSLRYSQTEAAIFEM